MDFYQSIKKNIQNLETIGLEHCESKDRGMHKSETFCSKDLKFSFFYDRGGIELVANYNESKYLNIINLANWLLDINKYQHPNLSQTNEGEKVDYNIHVLLNEFEMISSFLLNANEADIEKFEKKINLDAAKYWSGFFKDKGLPIPDSLKEILSTRD
jgi:hypothetical protein